MKYEAKNMRKKSGAPARQAEPGLAAQLPTASGQQTEPLKKKLLKTISVPIIRPSASADAPVKRAEMDMASIERNARRWGLHQQALEETHPKKGAGDAGDGKAGQAGDGPIQPGMLIMEVVEKYPQTLEILMESGLHCIGCQLSAYDTLETGCALHGMGPEDVQKLVKKMNQKLREEAAGKRKQA
jgi:hybrid cluster-associated redox disulfide protein